MIIKMRFSKAYIGVHYFILYRSLCSSCKTRMFVENFRFYLRNRGIRQTSYPLMKSAKSFRILQKKIRAMREQIEQLEKSL